MKLIITTLGSYLTGDGIADALLDYNHALSRARATDLVDIPVVRDRETSRLRLTIGWLVQLHTLETTSDEPELFAPATMMALRARTARSVGGDSGAAGTLESWLEDADLFEYGL